MHNEVIPTDEVFLILVAGDSRTTAVAGSVAKATRDGNRPVLQAIGAGAVNQALKAIIVARSYLEQDGIDLMFTANFTEVDVDGQERTAV
jgi:stage V sporulation protein S